MKKNIKIKKKKKKKIKIGITQNDLNLEELKDTFKVDVTLKMYDIDNDLTKEVK